MRLAVFFSHVKAAAKERGMSMDDAFAWVASLGIEAMDFDAGSLTGGEEELVPLLRKHSLSVSSIYGFCSFAEAQPSDADFRLYRLAERCGCGCVMPLPGKYTEGGDRAAQWDSITRAMETMALFGKEVGIVTVMENFDAALSPFSHTDALLGLHKAAPDVWITFDTGNFLPAREDPLASYAVLAPFIRHVHLKDHHLTAHDGAKPSQPLPDGPVVYPAAIGDGIVPIRGLITRLAKDGYTGAVTMEHFGCPDQGKAVEASAAFMRGVLDAL